MTHREQWLRRHGIPASQPLSIERISHLAGLPPRVLQQVYNRGIGAHRTNPASVRLRGSFRKHPTAPLANRLTAQQWAMARVYAFVNKLEQNRLNHDTDLVPAFQIAPSTRKNKKYVATFSDERAPVHFGHPDYQQYFDRIGHYAHLDHRDQARRLSYFARHGKHPRAFTAKWFAHNFLWS